MNSLNSPPAEQPGFFNQAPLSGTQGGVCNGGQYESRSQNTSAANMPDQEYQKAQQPINKAVTQAFDKAEGQHGISPELLNQITSQITANVIQQLKTTNLNTQISQEAPQAPATGVTLPASPSTHSASSNPSALRDVYTPPTPHLPEDLSPESPSVPNRPSQLAPDLTSSPERTAVSPVSQGSRSSESPRRESQDELDQRPKGPRRLSSGQDATLVERVWGSLYDENGVPTARLGQFLRGIANYLIESYEPTHSLVATPEKMQRFYRDTSIGNEIYPWQDIFDDRTSSISRLFRELGVVHHLVQEEGHYDERPDLPGLTPRGFQTWMSLLLQSNPDQEFERLQRVVRDMPISNADDRKDRFPKEISRRLFPDKADATLKERLEKALKTHCAVKLPMKAAAPSEAHSNINHRRTDTTIHQPDSAPNAPNGIERERHPYSGTTSNASSSNPASVVDEAEGTPTPQPIERERKPYSAQPGGGKVYADANKPSVPSASATAAPLSAIQPPTTEPFKDPPRSRAYSTATSNRHDPTIPLSGAAPIKSRPIPIVSNIGARPPAAPSPFDLNSMGSGFSEQHTHPPPFHPRTGSMHRPRPARNRSPSLNDPHRHSEPEFTRPGSSYPDKLRDRERDYDRSAYDPNRMSVYEIGSSMPGRERGRYRYEGGSGSVSSGTGMPAPPPTSVKYPLPPMAANGSYHGNDDERYRQGGHRIPPLSGTPGTGYDYGASPGTHYR